MSQHNNEVGSTDQTIPAVQPVPGAAKKGSWLRIVIVVVVILGVIAAFRMWYESRELDKLSKRSPGLTGKP